MAWIELHDNLPDHNKVLDVSEALKRDKDLVVGKIDDDDVPVEAEA